MRAFAQFGSLALVVDVDLARPFSSDGAGRCDALGLAVQAKPDSEVSKNAWYCT